MTVGIQLSKGGIDSRSGNICFTLRNTFDDVAKYKAWLDTKTEESLTDLGYTSGEVAILKSAFTDLNNLRNIYYGLADLAEPQDFTAFAKQLIADL